MESIEKKKRKKGIMDCDLCNAKDLHEVLILRKAKFSRLCSKSIRKARRICWECARELFRKNLYNWGYNWRMVFLDCSQIMDKNKPKYMVIHA